MFGPLPPPTTFADGQRQFFGWMLTSAGIVFCLLGTILTGIIIWGPWSQDSETLRLYLVGGALASFFVGSISVIISLSIGGPVGRFSVKAGREGAELSAESDDAPPKVTATTTVITEPMPRGPVDQDGRPIL
jgi:hypothetical protein